MADRRPLTAVDAGQVKFHTTFFSWSSVFAGIFISFITFICLMALGMGIGGIALSDLEGARAVGIGGVAWTIIAAMVSLFIASFAASRVSNYISTGVGMVQGATIAALFFGLLFWMGSSLTGAVGGALGTVASAIPMPSANVADLGKSVLGNSEVKSFMNQQLAEIGVQPDQVDNVTMGIASRLVRGDTEGARSYLQAQTDLDPTQLENRMEAIQTRVSTVAAEVGEKTAQAFSVAGWFLFGMIL